MALEQRLIEPFEPEQVRGAVISYGLSSYGYDVRLASEFKLLPSGSANWGPRGTKRSGQKVQETASLRSAVTGQAPAILDPKALDAGLFQDFHSEALDLAPHSFVLGRTVEYFRIPANVLTLCLGKSSYARCGVVVNVTPFEPGWEGYATLCIANVGPWAVRLHTGEGIAQVIFFESDEPCDLTYADRRGKYQAQQGVTPTRLG